MPTSRKEIRETAFGAPFRVRAGKGYEFVIVHLNVKALEAGRKLDASRLQLHDINGKKHKCEWKETDLCDAPLSEEVTCKLPFLVPEGTALTKLQTGDVFIDLARIEKKN